MLSFLCPLCLLLYTLLSHCLFAVSANCLLYLCLLFLLLFIVVLWCCMEVMTELIHQEHCITQQFCHDSEFEMGGRENEWVQCYMHCLGSAGFGSFHILESLCP